MHQRPPCYIHTLSLVLLPAGFSANLLHATAGFAQPSPIQAQCWPIILSGHDLVGVAATGSGKTLAFGLPALQHIKAQKSAGAAASTPPGLLLLLCSVSVALAITFEEWLVVKHTTGAEGSVTACEEPITDVALPSTISLSLKRLHSTITPCVHLTRLPSLASLF